MAREGETHAKGRRLVRLVVAAVVLLSPACAGDGHFSLLGYSTRPNYDTRFRTIRVPIFQTKTLFSVQPVPGLEMDLTRALIREIETKTPYKVVAAGCAADTELSGIIVSFTQGVINYNQLYEKREVETTLLVEVSWRDLQTGKLLNQPFRRPGQPLPPVQPLSLDQLAQQGGLPSAGGGLAIPTTPSLPGVVGDGDAGPALAPDGTPLPVEDPTKKPKGLLIRSVAYYRPELGESISTAMKMNVDKMATQLVQMMEVPW